MCAMRSIQQSDLLRRRTHYFALEEDVIRVGRFVELCEDNFGAYSIEATRLLLGIGSEIDIVAKMFCRLVEPGATPKNIEQYREIVMNMYGQMAEYYVGMAYQVYRCRPWLEWRDGINPPWWQAYNNVKHHGYDMYKEANVGNVLHSLMGLFQLGVWMGRHVKIQLWSDAKLLHEEGNI